MINNKKTVVREENFGLLIWSPKLDSYFLPDTEIIGDIKSIIKIKEENSTNDIWQNHFDTDLVADLIKLGFNEDIRTVNNSLKERLSAPLDVYFDYTHACNLKCPYCYNSEVNRSVTMPNDKIIQVLTQMSENGVMRTHLAGGEPMINIEGFETYLKTAAKLGMNASVNCNGTLVTDKALDAIFDNNVITLTFSLDGPNAEYNDFYRSQGSFKKTRSNARLTAKEKKVRGCGTKLQYKAIHMFDTPLDIYEGLITVAIDDGMDRMQFHNPECSVYHSQGHYRRPKVIKGYYERVQHIMELREKYIGQIEIWNVWNPLTGCSDIGLPGYHGCIGGQELIAIDAKGDIKPCLMNKFNLGNLFDGWKGDFSIFWRQSEKLAQYQKVADQVDPHCDSCKLYSQCRGGRKTRIITQNRDDSSSNPIKLDDIILLLI